ncbi:TPA: hypothetical protein N2903_003809 [Vibrio parahaemolyticus]|uniref:hypothetical protein n=1 Tax=Vibrio parahaemolyticus TaxID=670 RepID=UPI003B67EF45|nr:hypothetical protein [Vibrio parahaemolyticus]
MVKDSLKVPAFFLFVVLFLFVYFGFNTVLLSGDENYASDTASKPSTTSKVNPVEGGLHIGLLKAPDLVSQQELITVVD